MVRRALLQGIAFAGLAVVIQLMRAVVFEGQPFWDGGLVAVLAAVGFIGGILDVRRRQRQARDQLAGGSRI